MLQSLGVITDAAPVLAMDTGIGHFCFIGRHFRHVPVGKGIVVNPGKMRDIDKTFDLPPGGRLDIDRRR